MRRYAVIARDPTVDIYKEDDFYGVEVVDADSVQDAENQMSDKFSGLHVVTVGVPADTTLGWHDSCDFWMENP